MSTPLLIISDAITSPTGLGRITRELAVRIHDRLPEFRVATAGIGGGYSSRFGFPNYPITRVNNWSLPELPIIWKDFAGDSRPKRGIIMAIWNSSYLPWLADPSLLADGDLKSFLQSEWMSKWLYCPIDSDGPNGKLSESERKIFTGFDRVLTYTEWAAGVIDRTMYDFTPRSPCEFLPHGTDDAVFYPRSQDEARRSFIGRIVRSGEEGRLDPEMLLIGVCATNTPRKDWPLAFETCRILIDRGHKMVGLWAHTDTFRKHWDLPTMAVEFGLKDRVMFTNNHLSDEDMAWGYAACDVTLGIGSGEGWGYPLSESLACGIPVVHGDYAGGAEFVPEEFKVKPVAFRYDGYYINRRPVFNAKDWADVVDIAMGREARLEKKYTWDCCWPKWAEWLKEGL